MLLEHPANVRDLLSLVHAPWLDEIDFRRMQQIKTTFIRRDYRHLESDIVLTAPLAGPRKGPGKNLLIYILIEHQSEPDRLMPLRWRTRNCRSSGIRCASGPKRTLRRPACG